MVPRATSGTFGSRKAGRRVVGSRGCKCSYVWLSRQVQRKTSLLAWASPCFFSVRLANGFYPSFAQQANKSFWRKCSRNRVNLYSYSEKRFPGLFQNFFGTPNYFFRTLNSCLPFPFPSLNDTLYFLLELKRFPELFRAKNLFPGLSSPGKSYKKFPGLSRFSRTRTSSLGNYI